MRRILVLIPVYNEVENVGILVEDIFALHIQNLEILLIDDGSCDGTIELIRCLQKKYNKGLHVLFRNKKMGIGNAHLRGINWAYDNKFDFLITMDADLTHLPLYVPNLVKALSFYDMVIASRYVRGSEVYGWSLLRKVLNFFNHFLVSLFFFIYFDTSNAFRAYNLNNIPREIFDKISSSSYSFFFESIVYLKENKISIGEIPLVMNKRAGGRSKLGLKDIFLHAEVFLSLLFRFYFNRSCLKID